MSRPEVGLIWAQAHDGVIGRDGGLPWHLPEDQRHFRQVTDGGCVLMGRATWESLPERYRPLPGRRNIVLTRQQSYQAPGAEVHHDLVEALTQFHAQSDGELWVMGGGEVYRAAMPFADRLVVTEIDVTVEGSVQGTGDGSERGDVHAPAVDERWQQVASDPEQGWHVSQTGLRYRILDYRPAVRTS